MELPESLRWTAPSKAGGTVRHGRAVLSAITVQIIAPPFTPLYSQVKQDAMFGRLPTGLRPLLSITVKITLPCHSTPARLGRTPCQTSSLRPSASVVHQSKDHTARPLYSSQAGQDALLDQLCREGFIFLPCNNQPTPRVAKYIKRTTRKY